MANQLKRGEILIENGSLVAKCATCDHISEFNEPTEKRLTEKAQVIGWDLENALCPDHNPTPTKFKEENWGRIWTEMQNGTW